MPMLADLRSHTMIAAQDLDRAKRFYADKLGLTGMETIQGLLVFDGSKGGRFCLFASPQAGTAKNVVMAWETPDIASEVSSLKARGVVFEEYDLPNFKTIGGIVTVP